MVDIAKIERLMQLMQQYGVDVLEAEEGGQKVALAKNASHANFFQMATQRMVAENSGSAPAMNHQAGASQYASPVAHAAPVQTAAPARSAPQGTPVKSPFVGTFYRSPSPDSPSFVEVGDRVRKGQTLCIIEAMKIMNELESEVDGEVLAICADNGKPVEFDSTLFIIGPSK